MNKPTKKHLYGAIKELTKQIKIYENILEEFKIKKVREEITSSPYAFESMIIKRLYKRGEEEKFMWVQVDDEFVYLYGVDKNGK